MTSINRSYLFTSESVSEGHPDKLADQVSDAILDAYLALDPDAKVACETLVTTNQVVIAGEVHSGATVDVVDVARSVIREVGYTDPSIGFDADSANYLNLLHRQSSEIRESVRNGGAGDQGLMFGYACRETPGLMPLPIFLSHIFMHRLAHLRKCGLFNWLKPDAKSQVTVRYENGKPVEVVRVVLSTQHSPGVSQETIRELMIDEVIRPMLEIHFHWSHPECLVNPSGSFTIGGPNGDTGLTGRKIIVDTYGGSCPHGGGAFSGKDPSKVDRSAAYMARYVAKHIVSAGLADRCTVQLSYAIGVAEPTSVYVDTHGTCRIPDDRIATIVGQTFDLTPLGIIGTLGLKAPIYRPTSYYGHFGRLDFPWENTNANSIRSLQQAAM